MSSKNNILICVLLAAFLLPVSYVPSQNVEIKLMTINVWSGENTTAGRNKIAEIIETVGADVIAIQEMGNSAGQQIAQSLGFFYHQQSVGDIQIISRFPLAGRSPANYGALIAVQPGHFIWVFNCHLAAYPYQPYDLRDGLLPPNESAVVAAAEAARGGQVDTILADMTAALASDDPVFLAGDFNEPSHLDWTQAAASATARPFDLKVEYPAAKKITLAGMTDSFRSVRSDEVNDRAYTWTPGYPPPNRNANEVHDRIDLFYHHGNQIVPLSAQNVGLDELNPNTDIAISGYNADHRAVLVQYSIPRSADSSLLTFAGLSHNPGNDSALNNGGYGDRWVATPNIVVEFSATGTSHWDTYDGDYDNNGDNNWNGGVGQLQYGTGSAEYDIHFTPDVGYGVVVESFDLVDYVNFAVGHTVNWEMWSGQPNAGKLLAGGQEMIQPDSINSVTTGYSSPIHGLVTLRIEHLAGDGTDLAVDNLLFRQVPAPDSKYTPESITVVDDD